MEMENFELTWQAPEFEYREKGIAWYWASIGVAVALLALAVWQRNFLLGVFIVLAEIMVMIWGNQEPRMIEFRLDGEGLTVANSKSYAYADVENFAIDNDTNEEWAEVVLSFKKRLRAPLKVIFSQEDREEVRTILSRFLVEVEHERSLVDALEKFIRF
ncbi:MAG: Uncharacterized protein G01um101420_743 [Parcubacteria group bacterium Gr01-1014_20]|nr:MAG: Uncharacterized protein G01um101420_743 [Parcubacteria group bacterium Gr01-1014_20]